MANGAEDWLEEFVEYASYGEASPRAMYWVGISVIAAVLRRKAWFDQEYFQWSPNFYILLVGAPGAIKKSTSIDIGMSLLKQVPGINLGPSITTWQALIEYIAQCREDVTIPETGEVFEMSAVTLALSEFGAFFDPQNRELIDNLTDLWDGKKGRIEKRTKTSGSDEMVNPWINLIAATTPKWLAQHFGEELVGGGLAGRFIFLNEDMPTKDVAYPKRQMKDMAKRRAQQAVLVEKLSVMAGYAGDFVLSEEAYEWGEVWYAEERAKLRALGTDSLESGFVVRKQVHLHKLAMVICASRQEFPNVTREHLVEAAVQLDVLDVDMRKVLGFVGQSKLTTASQKIVELLLKDGPTEKRKLFQKNFFKTLSYGEFEEAVRSAVQAEYIFEQDGVAKPMLVPRR